MISIDPSTAFIQDDGFAITAAEPWYDQVTGVAKTAMNTLFNPFWWYDSTATVRSMGLYGFVRLSDLQQCVNPATVKAAADMMAANAASANNIQNKIKSLAKGAGQMTGDIISSFASGAFSGAGGLLTVFAVGFVIWKVALDQPERYYKPKAR